jgi:hypothetical protein
MNTLSVSEGMESGRFIPPDVASKLCVAVAAALTAARREAIEECAKVVHEEAREAEICEWGERHAMNVTVRAWLFNAAGRIRALAKPGGGA